MFRADILKMDARFVSLLKWLGENHIHVQLSGENREDGYAVYKIRETAFRRRNQAVRSGRIFTVYDRDDLLASERTGGGIDEDEDGEETG